MSLERRILLGVLGTVLLVGLLGGVLFSRIDRDYERRRVEALATALVEGVREHIRSEMTVERHGSATQMIGELRLPAPISRVTIVGGAGVVRESTDPRLVGQARSRRDPACSGCHADSLRARGVPGGEALSWGSPIRNEPACAPCHGAERAVLACLVVDFEPREARRLLGSGLGELLTVLLGTLLLAGTVFYGQVRLVLSRVELLARRMGRYERGETVAVAPPRAHDEVGLLEEGFNRMVAAIAARDRERNALLEQLQSANAELEEEIRERRAATEELARSEESVRRGLEGQRLVAAVLRLSVEELTIEELLERALEQLLSRPWLGIEPRGAVFVAEERGDELRLAAARGLPPALLAACARVRPGRCLCGRAAAGRAIVFADGVDERHEVHYAGMAPHGHYCVPILSGGALLGVLTLYLAPGHRERPGDRETLAAAADALAGVIRRERAEEEVRRSERRFRTLAETADEAIFVFGPDRALRYANPACARLLGRPAAALVHRSLGELFPGGTLAGGAGGRLDAVFREGATLRFEEPLALPAAEAWLDTSVVPIRDGTGRVAAAFGMARDVTAARASRAERERLIERLRELLESVSSSKREWEGTFDAIADMIVLLDAAGRFVKVNRAYAAFRRRHPRDFVGEPCADPLLAGVGQIRRGSWETGPRAREPVVEEAADPETRRVFRVTTVAYAAGGAAIDRVVHVMEEITELREHEQRLIMRERLAALGEMASGIAHEINNPLASISGCSEALLRRLAEERFDPALFSSYLGIIQEEIARSKAITGSMLSFVRGRGPERARLDLAAVLDRALDLLGFQGRLRNVEVERRYADALPPCTASEQELRQVFLILLANALDAMDDHGRLVVETREAAGGRIEVALTDSGRGIAPGAEARLFTPFFTTRAARGGTGLGLSIARRIIEEHGGTVALATAPGGGAVATVTLPPAPA